MPPQTGDQIFNIGAFGDILYTKQQESKLDPTSYRCTEPWNPSSGHIALTHIPTLPHRWTLLPSPSYPRSHIGIKSPFPPQACFDLPSALSLPGAFLLSHVTLLFVDLFAPHGKPWRCWLDDTLKLPAYFFHTGRSAFETLCHSHGCPFPSVELPVVRICVGRIWPMLLSVHWMESVLRFRGGFVSHGSHLYSEPLEISSCIYSPGWFRCCGDSKQDPRYRL
jgi:hypothetical protein